MRNEKTSEPNTNIVSEKIKVEDICVIVEKMGSKPYYSLRYKIAGDDFYYSGYSSYCLDYVLDWKNQYFEKVQCENKQERQMKWIPCSERLPELKLVYESKFNNKYESEQVLVQTKRGEMFVAKCMKYTYTKDFKDEIEFYTYGTGGRRMKVKSKVVAWMPLPEPYKGE